MVARHMNPVRKISQSTRFQMSEFHVESMRVQL